MRKTEPLPLTDRVEPVASMRAEDFPATDLADVAFSLSEMMAHELAIFDLPQKQMPWLSLRA